ncbi:hypothetical protein BJ322DRAFT_1022115 [Thelephora terrestris]|uniref:Uncharacterized protein n=1 Tax=Thelephora terrestris TaxID=56493 RepID=A0A9P6L5V9_9AGAM|nr:hypothetical protein BJ322DRAFT_1022115 [Thelephora terrestris]
MLCTDQTLTPPDIGRICIWFHRDRFRFSELGLAKRGEFSVILYGWQRSSEEKSRACSAEIFLVLGHLHDLDVVVPGSGIDYAGHIVLDDSEPCKLNVKDLDMANTFRLYLAPGISSGYGYRFRPTTQPKPRRLRREATPDATAAVILLRKGPPSAWLWYLMLG